MKNLINAAIIGCGGIHHVHASVLNELDGVRLIAVCDNKPERAQASAEANNCQGYTDYHDMLKNPEIDAVHICTPHWLHAQMAIDALSAGKYVLVEKPMATNVADGHAMIAEDARQGGGRLCVVFQNRYNEAAAMLKGIIDGCKYGKLLNMRGSVVWSRSVEYYSDDWHGKKQLECGGVMINQAIHTLDMVQWLCGGAAAIKGAVSTDRHMGLIEVEDSAHMLIKMKSGVSAAFHATVGWDGNAPVEVEAVLEEGTFLMKGSKLYQVDEDYQLICDPEGKPIGERDYWGAGHRIQIGDFYRCIREHKPFFIDGVQGIEAVKLVLGLYESSETGKVVTLA